eukprot:10147620-Alexandrium_andersonii.AAC.1
MAPPLSSAAFGPFGSGARARGPMVLRIHHLASLGGCGAQLFGNTIARFELRLRFGWACGASNL